jgi:glycosyltransferase involved in cell wall biosynthesis
MKKLLFISPELPFPAQSGGKVKTLKLVQSLAERYRVTFVSPLKLEDADHSEEFARLSGCVRHVHAPVNVPRNARNLLYSYAQGWPLNVRRTLDRGLQRQVCALADEHDVVVLDHYEVLPYLPEDYAGMVVYHAHNAYFKIWERYATQSGNPAMRLAAYLEAHRVRRFEAAVAGRADLVFAAPNDARELVDAGVPTDKIQDTYHLGDDTQLALPELRFEDTCEKLMYVGFLGWEPNVQGLLWFIENVWPMLETRHPGLCFDIVGKNPDERLQAAVADCPAIRLTGYVADLQTVYRDSRVSVAPLLFGSGMKVKVLDAMARGIPTVTTSVGAEGIEVEDRVQLMIADDPSDMAGRIDELLLDRIIWERLQVASRALIRRQYTWQRLFHSMHGAIEACLKERRREHASQPVREAVHAG